MLRLQDNTDALQAHLTLSVILRELKIYDEAEALGRCVLAGHKSLYGTHHLMTTSAADELARTFLEQCAYEKSEKLALQVWDLSIKEARTEKFGADPPQTQQVAEKLASLGC